MTRPEAGLSRYSPHCKTDLRSLLSPLRACLTPASQELALRRLEQAGARLSSWIQVLLEFQRDWGRHETYEAARAIVVANGGGYGMGLAYG